jgi:putative addiction module component (TIGR02574 family)
VITLFNEVVNSALVLTKEQRAELAHKLIVSLDKESEAEVQCAWYIEIEKRIAEIKSGKASGRPAEQIFDEIRAKYA